MARIVIEIDGGLLTVGATPMDVARMNLWFDLAKQQTLQQRGPDYVIEEAPEHSGLGDQSGEEEKPIGNVPNWDGTPERAEDAI